MAQLFVGLMAEGSTDYRFLKPIIEKVLISLAYECKGRVDVEVFEIDYTKDGGFVQHVLDASRKGLNKYGIMALVAHSDADSPSTDNVWEYKMNPAFAELEAQDEELYCKKMVPIIPIHETESWMLADKLLFKKFIGSKQTDAQLGIEGSPESLTHPKEAIEAAIRIAKAELPKKLRYSLTIGDLYPILGEALQIESLSELNSFLAFKQAVRNVLIEFNYLDA